MSPRHLGRRAGPTPRSRSPAPRHHRTDACAGATAGRDQGAASVVLVGLVAVVMVLGLLVADVAIYLRGRVAAMAAADAAALAAAPVTFHGFGTSQTPAGEAERFAATNGAVLEVCDCPIDRTWRPRTVRVVVSVPARLIVFGDRTVAASSRAEFEPVRIAVPPGAGH